jgi:transcriptional regulator with XRE-family HTH domain
MDAAAIVGSILAQSGISKSALSSASGVSRALLDAYLKGQRQPSVAQLSRLAQAAGLELKLSIDQRPRPLPESFLAVLEFGELFPRGEPRPLLDMSPMWRKAALRASHA